MMAKKKSKKVTAVDVYVDLSRRITGLTERMDEGMAATLERISALRTEVSRLVGENTALKQRLSKLRQGLMKVGMDA